MKRIFTALMAIIACSAAYADQYAVLIGIEDYPGKPRQYQNVNLPGPSTDVDKMSALLSNRFGVVPANMKIIKNTQADYKGIKNLITWLTSKVKNGDQAIIFYSGHGTRVKDVNGDEADGYDEALVSNDAHNGASASEMYIIDDEINVWLHNITKKGAEVVMISDSCFSGTISKDFSKNVVSKYYQVDKAEAAKYAKAAKLLPKSESFENADPNITTITACTDTQESKSANFAGVGWMGVLTYHLNDYFTKSKGTPTYTQLTEYLKKNITVAYNQEPQVTTSDGDRCFLQTSYKPIPSPPVVQPQVVTAKTLNVALEGFGQDAGAVRNAINATTYAVVVSDPKQADRRLVRRAGSRWTANLDLLDGTVEDVVLGDKIPEFISNLKTGLAKAYIIKRLSTMKDSDTGIRPQIQMAELSKNISVVSNVSVATNVTIVPSITPEITKTVSEGTKVTFRIRVEKACYVTLIDIATGGLMTLLIPNDYQSSQLAVKPNQWYDIPSEQMSFDIVARPPFGRSVVMAVATTEPLDLSSISFKAIDGMSGMKEAVDIEPLVKMLNDKMFNPEYRKVPGNGSSQGKFAIAYLIAEVIK